MQHPAKYLIVQRIHEVAACRAIKNSFIFYNYSIYLDERGQEYVTAYGAITMAYKTIKRVRGLLRSEDFFYWKLVLENLAKTLTENFLFLLKRSITNLQDSDIGD